MDRFDTAGELARLQAQTQLQRRKAYRRSRSRLDRYHGELVSLSRAGALPTELQRWLAERHASVALSTVCRWLAKNGL